MKYLIFILAVIFCSTIKIKSSGVPHGYADEKRVGQPQTYRCSRCHAYKGIAQYGSCHSCQ